MRSVNVYQCDWCGKRFNDVYACQAHEDNTHPIEERLKMVPKSCMCPKCKGERYLTVGSNLYDEDIVECPMCGGVGIVIAERVVKYHTVTSFDIKTNKSTKSTKTNKKSSSK